MEIKKCLGIFHISLLLLHGLDKPMVSLMPKTSKGLCPRNADHNNHRYYPDHIIRNKDTRITLLRSCMYSTTDIDYGELGVNPNKLRTS